MLREVPFLEGNVYHIYNRGAHKADIFLDESDYSRFQLILFLANQSDRVNFRNIFIRYKGRSFAEIFKGEKIDDRLVDILGYTLMPNHFHIILHPRVPGGISKFMKKVGTAYSMYFNTKYVHSGTVFQGRFRSRYVDNDDYLRWLFAYIFLNPLDISYPNWKQVGLHNKAEAFNFLCEYLYSSFLDTRGNGIRRPEGQIISHHVIEDLGGGTARFSDIEELLSTEDMPAEVGPL